MKWIRISALAVIGYTLLRLGLLGYLFVFDSFNQLNPFHHGDQALWYLVWYWLPLLVGFIFAVSISSRFLLKIGYLFLPLLLVSTIIGGSLNMQYWGYAFRRPPVIQDIKEARTLLSLTYIEKRLEEETFLIFQDSFVQERLHARKQPYEFPGERVFMCLEDYCHIFDWYDKYHDPSQKISQDTLNMISSLILQSGILELPEGPYFEEANRLSGHVLELQKPDGEIFYYVTVESEQIANDHYAYYEFLIPQKHPIKVSESQMFFHDFAGYEYTEYGLFAPFVDGVLLILSIVLFLLWKGMILLRASLARRNSF